MTGSEGGTHGFRLRTRRCRDRRADGLPRLRSAPTRAAVMPPDPEILSMASDQIVREQQGSVS